MPEILIAILVIICILIIPNIKIVPQAKSYVIERLGSYFVTWQNGLHFKIPFIDNIANKVSLKDAWNNSIITELRKKHINKDVSNTICENCIDKIILLFYNIFACLR